MVVTLEDESVREVPTSMDLFRSIRKTVYSVLLNLNKLKIVHENQGNKRGGKSAVFNFFVYWTSVQTILKNV